MRHHGRQLDSGLRSLIEQFRTFAKMQRVDREPISFFLEVLVEVPVVLFATILKVLGPAIKKTFAESKLRNQFDCYAAFS